ncbi:hypothetical protein IHC92_18075 [Photobacterium damselae subsp. damselae]|uniref:hypothetical protein n=1 Tax=Photobacterium damselae TaxID=38293 RepID=UPI001F402FC2|nr:hypothetical protein [Photobacterium damselae]UKA08726.1 hypothetical protein IHC90_17095 [Photobacterium damselae subsp. damselae]UKA22877.1 hypothetical protein IHC92_18075 [Photobacterium damselae subsp. damselae]
MKEFVSVGYKPFAVSTQVTDGINYRFFCTATSINEEVTAYSVMLSIYKPLSGYPVITSVYEI